MKIIVNLALLIVPYFIFAQSEPNAQALKTKVEAFSEQSGKLIEKNVEDFGTVGSVKIKILRLKNLMTSDKISGLSFEYYNDIENVLDIDEIDGFVKSLTTMKSAVSTPRTTYTEITYKSPTGFEVGAVFDIDKTYYSRGEKKWMYHLTFVANNPIKVSLQPEDFMALCGYVEAAKNKL